MPFPRALFAPDSPARRGARVLRRAAALAQDYLRPPPAPPSRPDGRGARETPRLDLGGSIALVTGAGGELGATIARTLARCGADVAVHYRTSAARAERVRRDAESLGVRAITVQGDVADPASVAAMHREVLARLGEPDVLVLNAVGQYGWRSVLEQPLADFAGQYQTSVVHAVLLCQAFVPAMVARGRGRVVGISTECAVQCAPNQGAYVAGKRGMDGVLRVLAREVGRHQVTVNQVAPGWMVSDREREAGVNPARGYARRVPLRRRGDDHDVAHAVAFLASDLAAFITGAFVPVCGGNVTVGI